VRFPPLFKGALAPRHPRPAPAVRPPRGNADEFETLFAQLLEDMAGVGTLTHVRLVGVAPDGRTIVSGTTPPRPSFTLPRGYRPSHVWFDEVTGWNDDTTPTITPTLRAES
jgi:hypothetical protein